MSASKSLEDQIHSLALRSAKILYVAVDILDPKTKSIPKKKIQELKAQAEEIQKEAQNL